MSPKTLIDLFIEFEYVNKMFELKMDNTYIWHYIRFDVYYELLKIYGISDELLNTSKKNAFNGIRWKELIRKYTICCQFLVRHRDILIIPHERKYRDGDKYYKCIFTNLLDIMLSNSHYILDNKSVENVYALQKSHNVIYCDIENFKELKKLNYSNKLINKMEMEKFLIKPIERYFNISIDLETKKRTINKINYILNNKKYFYEYYNYMLNKISPKIILMVVSYSFDRMVLCEVAKKKKIPVIELQHGEVGTIHVAYNFYKKMRLSSFPDYFFSFGQYEKENVRFPISRDKIIPVGYPELEKYCSTYNKKKRNKKVILFISQGLESIAKYANIVAEKLDSQKYQVVFQLHPKEYYDWNKKIGRFLKCSNIKVIGSFEHTIHESLSNADWVIGNYSSVLYEALMFDVKVCILKTGLYVEVEHLYKNGYALLIESPEQLIDEIEKNCFEPNRKINIFETNSLKKMQTNINKIIKKYKS